MALMIVGFGLKDSIFEIAGLQYGDIQKNDGTAYLKEDLTDKDYEEIEKYLDSDSKIESYTESLTKKIDVSHGKNTEELYLFVPKDRKEIESYITFRDRITQKGQKLTDKGVILTEKIAKSLDVKRGDELSIRVHGENKKVRIADITENYMGHYLYMTPALYEEVYEKQLEYNSVLFKIHNYTDKRLLKAGEDAVAVRGSECIIYEYDGRPSERDAEGSESCYYSADCVCRHAGFCSSL